MNNVFSISRFGNLLRKHTAEHYKTYLMSVVVLMGIIGAIAGWAAYISTGLIGEGGQFAIFMSIMLLSGAIFTSGIFTEFDEPKKAIAMLTLPASHFEKFLVKWLFSYLLFMVVFTGIFYTVMIAVIEMSAKEGQHLELLHLFRHDNFEKIFISFTLAHAIAMLGAIVFRKLHFIKTVFTMTGIFIVLGIANKWIVEGMIGRKISGAFPFVNLNFNEQVSYGRHISYTAYSINPPADSGIVWSYVLVAAVTLLFWAAAYSRLKEKQV